MGFELGEGHLDRIEVWTIGRQEEKPRAALLEDGLPAIDRGLDTLPKVNRYGLPSMLASIPAGILNRTSNSLGIAIAILISSSML